MTFWPGFMIIKGKLSGGGIEEVRVGPYCSGVKPIGCHNKFRHIAKQKRHRLCSHCVPMFYKVT